MNKQEWFISTLCRVTTVAVIATAIGLPLGTHHYLEPSERPRQLLADGIRRGDVAAVARAAKEQLNAPADTGYTPLMLAVVLDRLDVAKLLLSRGADVNATWTGTPLTLAASWGHEEILRLLLAHGADVQTPNLAGHDALFLAAVAGHAGCVRALLDAGADPSRIQNGETALSAAKELGHDECAAAIQSHLSTVPETIVVPWPACPAVLSHHDLTHSRNSP